MASNIEMPDEERIRNAFDELYQSVLLSLEKIEAEAKEAINQSVDILRDDVTKVPLQYGVELLWTLIKSISVGIPGSIPSWKNEPPSSIEEVVNTLKALPESLITDLLDNIETSPIVKEGLKDAVLTGSINFFKQLLYENHVDVTRLSKVIHSFSFDGEDPANIIIPFLREGKVDPPPEKKFYAIVYFICKNSKWFSPREKDLTIRISQKEYFSREDRELITAAVNGVDLNEFLNQKLTEGLNSLSKVPESISIKRPTEGPVYKADEQGGKRGKGGRIRSVWLMKKYSRYSDEQVGIELRTTIWPKLQQFLAPLPLPNVGNSRTKGDLKSLGAALLFYVFKQLGIASESATYGRAFERTMVVMGAEEGKLMGKKFSAGPFARNSTKDHFAAVSRILPALCQLKDEKRVNIYKLMEEGTPLEQALINGHLHLMAAYEYLIKELPSIFVEPE